MTLYEGRLVSEREIRGKHTSVCSVLQINKILQQYQLEMDALFVFRKEIWIMDSATDQYYRWLTVIAGPVFYNLIMIVTRYEEPLHFLRLIAHLVI